MCPTDEANFEAVTPNGEWGEHAGGRLCCRRTERGHATHAEHAHKPLSSSLSSSSSVVRSRRRPSLSSSSSLLPVFVVVETFDRTLLMTLCRVCWVGCAPAAGSKSLCMCQFALCAPLANAVVWMCVNLAAPRTSDVFIIAQLRKSPAIKK